MAPLERLKILMQVQGNASQVYTGVWQVRGPATPATGRLFPCPELAALKQGCMHMWRTEGLRGMFKGNGTNCVRIIPNSAVKFFAYEHMARCKSPRRPHLPLSLVSLRLH